jgi:S-DNA-T family DNA segregation ATPase FtsK/SpoIIIE
MKASGKKSAKKKPTARKGTARRKAGRRSTLPPITLDTWVDIFAGVLLLLSAIVFLAAIAPGGNTTLRSVAVAVGGVFGWALYITPLVTGAVAVYLLVRRFGDRLPLPGWKRMAGALLGFAASLPSLHAFGGWILAQDGAALAGRGAGGGAAGWALQQALTGVLGNVGAVLALLLLWFTALLLVSDMTPASFAEQARALVETFSTASSPVVHTPSRASAPAKVRPAAAEKRTEVKAAPDADFARDDEPDEAEEAPPPRTVAANVRPMDARHAAGAPSLPEPTFRINGGSGGIAVRQGELNRLPPPRVLGATTASAEENSEPAAAEAKPSASQPSAAAQPVREAKAAEPPTPEKREWSLPNVEDMLDSGSESTMSEADIRARAALIEETLLSFGVPGRVTEVNRGPTITQFGVEPGFVEMKGGKTMKVKVGRIAALADDLALALAAPRIRIEAPVPGRAIVGIEVPNGETALVSLRDVIESEAFEKIERKSRLALAFGQDVSGHPVVADLAEMPHLLIAGTTGSGKSVCVNGIIVGLLCNNSPDDVRFLMIDPKRVELTGYNGVPHLISPVIVDVDKAPAVLKWTMREMDTRYKTFAKHGARNIVDYNARAAAAEAAGDASGDRPKKLPYIVLVVDELADLMMMSPEETERAIIRLAQMARATGIHLILATQRPSVDVVTGLIKANFPARIAFTVATAVDSRVILDGPGAEKLLGRGDMLALMPGSSAAMRAQGCFLSPKEIERVVRHWRAQAAGPAPAAAAAAAPASGVDVLEDMGPAQAKLPLSGGENGGEATEADPLASHDPYATPPTWDEAREMADKSDAGADKDDKLFNDAVNAVRLQGKASISLLQRRLRIGYTRAARLIEEMEERGIVGPSVSGQQHREVL